ncbi:MAG: putative epoxide hydrolase [Hydrocarboniphaga sp.]|uniref:epoxide hydrolase N-terminal domain-containing protein n=1 Tax=Hydrocarboniphaga sp. TaxID=2033016 RepID=UPI00260A17D5|nr:epoxide hydrolase N-terminal domain-containing protein [Hydrocarboniphaga sp.]MDB5971279.1 putative epoxide hydrolase [Hydrocarboniphaga sp.]
MNARTVSRKWVTGTLAAGLALAALTMIRPASAAGSAFAAPERVREYDLQVSNKNLTAAKAEIDVAGLSSFGADGGPSRESMQNFSWARAEQVLNAYPQYLGRVGGIDLPFYYVRGEGRQPPVLLLTQSTPGSIVQLLANVDALTHPSRHGGNAQDAVTLVIASLPGSSFSSLTQPATSDLATAKLWNELLTEVIGVPRYQVHGEGLGSGAVAQLLRLYPRTVTASKAGSLPVATNEALLTDLVLSRLDQNGMERNMRLFAAAQASADQGFWPSAISNPIVLARRKVEVTDFGTVDDGRNRGADR